MDTAAGDSLEPSQIGDSELGYASNYRQSVESIEDADEPLAYKVQYSSVYENNKTEPTSSLETKGSSFSHGSDAVVQGATGCSGEPRASATPSATDTETGAAFQAALVTSAEADSSDEEDSIARAARVTRTASMSARSAAAAAAALAARTAAMSERISSGLNAKSVDAALQLLDLETTAHALSPLSGPDAVSETTDVSEPTSTVHVSKDTNVPPRSPKAGSAIAPAPATVSTSPEGDLETEVTADMYMNTLLPLPPGSQVEAEVTFGAVANTLLPLPPAAQQASHVHEQQQLEGSIGTSVAAAVQNVIGDTHIAMHGSDGTLAQSLYDVGYSGSLEQVGVSTAPTTGTGFVDVALGDGAGAFAYDDHDDGREQSCMQPGAQGTEAVFHHGVSGEAAGGCVNTAPGTATAADAVGYGLAAYGVSNMDGGGGAVTQHSEVVATRAWRITDNTDAASEAASTGESFAVHYDQHVVDSPGDEQTAVGGRPGNVAAAAPHYPGAVPYEAGTADAGADTPAPAASGASEALSLDDYRIAAAAGLVSPQLASLLGLSPPPVEAENKYPDVEEEGDDDNDGGEEQLQGGAAVAAALDAEAVVDRQELGGQLGYAAGPQEGAEAQQIQELQQEGELHTMPEQKSMETRGVPDLGSAGSGAAGEASSDTVAALPAGASVAPAAIAPTASLGRAGSYAAVSPRGGHLSSRVPSTVDLYKRALESDPFDAADTDEDEAPETRVNGPLSLSGGLAAAAVTAGLVSAGAAAGVAVAAAGMRHAPAPNGAPTPPPAAVAQPQPQWGFPARPTWQGPVQGAPTPLGPPGPAFPGPHPPHQTTTGPMSPPGQPLPTSMRPSASPAGAPAAVLGPRPGPVGIAPGPHQPPHPAGPPGSAPTPPPHFSQPTAGPRPIAGPQGPPPYPQQQRPGGGGGPPPTPWMGPPAHGPPLGPHGPLMQPGTPGRPPAMRPPGMVPPGGRGGLVPGQAQPGSPGAESLARSSNPMFGSPTAPLLARAPGPQPHVRPPPFPGPMLPGGPRGGPPPCPYPGLLYTDGRDGLGRTVVVINTAMLPGKAQKNAVLGWLLQQLQPVVQREYVLVVLSLALGVKASSVSSVWALGAYRSLAKPYRKNVKHIVLVQPSAWARTLLALVQPFVSKKAAHKVKKVDNLVQVAEVTGGEVRLESLGARFIREIQYGLGAPPLAGLVPAGPPLGHNGPNAAAPGPGGPPRFMGPPPPQQHPHHHPQQHPQQHPQRPPPYGMPPPQPGPGTPPNGMPVGPAVAPYPMGPPQPRPPPASNAATPVYGPGGPGPAAAGRLQGPPPPRPQFPGGPVVPGGVGMGPMQARGGQGMP